MTPARHHRATSPRLIAGSEPILERIPTISSRKESSCCCSLDLSFRVLPSSPGIFGLYSRPCVKYTIPPSRKCALFVRQGSDRSNQVAQLCLFVLIQPHPFLW